MAIEGHSNATSQSIELVWQTESGSGFERAQGWMTPQTSSTLRPE